jgi:predicted component of type VI protein secretion system
MTEGAMERMALAGLQELAASLVPGARLENEADVGALITRLHDTMEMFCRTVAPVLDEHRAFLEEYGLRMANEEHDDAEEDDPTGEVPQERRVDPVLLARRLLDWRAGGVAFHKTFERQLGAFHGHSEALVSATLRGIDHLLQEFSPESLDERMDRGGHHGVAFVVNPRRAFRAIYEDHYRHVAEERRLAQVLLGPAFARRYHAARSQGSKS